MRMPYVPVCACLLVRVGTQVFICLLESVHGDL